jgi:hypothetical protein
MGDAMTATAQEQTREKALKVVWPFRDLLDDAPHNELVDALCLAIEQARSEEREECAKVVEGYRRKDGSGTCGCPDCTACAVADSIRARGGAQ